MEAWDYYFKQKDPVLTVRGRRRRRHAPCSPCLLRQLLAPCRRALVLHSRQAAASNLCPLPYAAGASGGPAAHRVWDAGLSGAAALQRGQRGQQRHHPAAVGGAGGDAAQREEHHLLGARAAGRGGAGFAGPAPAACGAVCAGASACQPGGPGSRWRAVVPPQQRRGAHPHCQAPHARAAPPLRRCLSASPTGRRTWRRMPRRPRPRRARRRRGPGSSWIASPTTTCGRCVHARTLPIGRRAVLAGSCSAACSMRVDSRRLCRHNSFCSCHSFPQLEKEFFEAVGLAGAEPEAQQQQQQQQPQPPA